MGYCYRRKSLVSEGGSSSLSLCLSSFRIAVGNLYLPCILNLHCCRLLRVEECECERTKNCSEREVGDSSMPIRFGWRTVVLSEVVQRQARILQVYSTGEPQSQDFPHTRNSCRCKYRVHKSLIHFVVFISFNTPLSAFFCVFYFLFFYSSIITLPSGVRWVAMSSWI